MLLPERYLLRFAKKHNQEKWGFTSSINPFVFSSVCCSDFGFGSPERNCRGRSTCFGSHGLFSARSPPPGSEKGTGEVCRCKEKQHFTSQQYFYVRIYGILSDLAQISLSYGAFFTKYFYKKNTLAWWGNLAPSFPNPAWKIITNS